MANLLKGREEVAKRLAKGAARTKEKIEQSETYQKMHEALDEMLPEAKPEKAALPPEEVAKGQDLRKLTDEYSASLTPEARNNLKGAIAEIMETLGVTLDGDVVDGVKTIALRVTMADGTKKVRRISEIMSEAIDRQTEAAAKAAIKGDDFVLLPALEQSQLKALQESYGLTAEQFGEMFISEFSDAGRTLQFASAMSKGTLNPAKLYDQLMKESKILNRAGVIDDEFSKALGEGYSPANTRKLRTFITNLDTARRGLMTVQMATTMRNTIGGGLRAALFLVDNMFHGGLDLATAGTDKMLRKQAIARMGSGARLWKTLIWNQSEANALRLLFHEQMPTTFRKLYRQNADVADELGSGKMSGFSKFARKLNVLNTYSDNAFKRAVFLSELQTQLGGKQQLTALIRAGRFSELGEEKYTGAIENSIKEANRLVYQRTFREKKYTRKLAADQEGRKKWLPKKRISELEEVKRYGPSKAEQLLGIFSTPLTTWALPFPKFIMNSLEFMWTHAPIIGLSGFSKEAISKNMSGMAIFYGAIQLRAAQGPEARWWEFYDKETKEHKNAIALYGPFAPYMLAADLVLRSNMNKEGGRWAMGTVPIIAGSEAYQTEANEKWARVIKDPIVSDMFKDGMFREYAKAVFGTTFRTGIGLDFVKELQTEIQTSRMLELEENEAAMNAGMKAVAKFGGMYANTFLVGGGMIRDLYSSIDPQYEKIRDTNAVTNAGDIFIANSLKSLPISDAGKYMGLFKGPEGIELVATSPTQQEELRREGRDLTQFTGLGSQVVLPEIENELIRLDLPRYKEYKSYRRQPDLNRRANAIYQKYTAEVIVPYINGREYNSLNNDPRRQKVVLRGLFSDMRARVSELLLQETSREYNRFFDQPEKADKVQDELIFLLRAKLDRLGKDASTLAIDAFKAAEGVPPRVEGRGAITDMLKLIEYARRYR